MYEKEFEETLKIVLETGERMVEVNKMRVDQKDVREEVAADEKREMGYRYGNHDPKQR